MELTLDQALQKGIEAHKAGKLQEADRYYTAILQAQPKHPDANHHMGVLAVGVGKVEAALPFFKTALEANSSIAQYWLSYIDALIKLERLVDAKVVFDQAKNNGAKGDAFDDLEQRLVSSGNTQSDAQDPPQNQIQPLVNFYRQGQYQEAFNQASQLLLEFPRSVTLYNIIGAANTGLGKLEEAIEAYKKAIDLKPDYADAFNNLGLAFQAQGKLDKAIDAYTKALSIKPNYAEANYNMGNALKDQGQLEEAIEAYNKALAIKPDYADAYYNMGVTLQEQGKLEEAIEAFNKALAIKPDNAEAYNNMGNALKEQGNLEEAIEAYNKALAIKPDYADTYYNMGVTLQEQGKLEEAIEAYNKVLAIKPDYADAYYNMGNALKAQGNLEEAIEAYTKAISIKPDFAEAHHNATELLKTYCPKSEIPQGLFTIDSKIKNLSPRILNATSDREIIDNLLEGLSYITKDTFEYKTPLSQIYKRNTVDLNCKRHIKIFNTQNIIPEFCFGCFKVQVEVATVIDLVKVASFFYKFDFEEDLTKKTIIELRPNISGFYKGLIYCNSLHQAQAVKTLLDISLKEIFGEETRSKIKRGCSEYPLKFPSYGKIPENSKKIMSFPEEWRQLEKKFDQDDLIKPDETKIASLPEFCLSDFYIIQKWIDYAKGIGDQSIKTFNDRRIIFKDIYEMAKRRAI